MMIAQQPSPAHPGSFEQASADFIQRYLQAWSGPAPSALAYMDHIYPDQVDFYGKRMTHAALMTLKRKFVAHWPERTLSVRPDSIEAACDPDHRCTVQAIFDWHYRNSSRQAVSYGSASLTLDLQDGSTILSENGTVIPSSQAGNRPVPMPLAPTSPVATQPASPPDIPAAPMAEPRPQPQGPHAQAEGAISGGENINPPPEAIAELRNAYLAHAADKDWLATWLAEKRDFSGQAVFVGSVEDQAGPGSAGVLHTDGFASAAGTIACINPDEATPLKVGENVNLHGVITVFIENVMYLGQCSIQPG
jgi:hypothetical protein